MTDLEIELEGVSKAYRFFALKELALMLTASWGSSARLTPVSQPSSDLNFLVAASFGINYLFEHRS